MRLDVDRYFGPFIFESCFTCITIAATFMLFMLYNLDIKSGILVQAKHQWSNQNHLHHGLILLCLWQCMVDQDGTLPNITTRKVLTVVLLIMQHHTQ